MTFNHEFAGSIPVVVTCTPVINKFLERRCDSGFGKFSGNDIKGDSPVSITSTIRSSSQIGKASVCKTEIMGSNPIFGVPACQDKHVEVIAKIRLDGGSLPPTSTLHFFSYDLHRFWRIV